MTEGACPFGEDVWNTYVDHSWNLLSKSTQQLYQQVISLFIQTFEDDNSLFKSDVDHTMSIDIDFEALKTKINDVFFEKAIRDQTELILSSLSIALHTIIFPERNELNGEKTCKIFPRLHNFTPISPLRSLKSNVIGKFVSTKGTVVSVSNIKPIIVKMMFSCSVCHKKWNLDCREGKLQSPERCITTGCRSKVFLPQRDNATTCDWQRIRLQEILDGKDRGRIPRCIDIELTEDLVDRCVPGDIVTVTGIVKTSQIQERSNFSNKDKQPVYYRYIDTNSIVNGKQTDTGKLDLIQFSLRDLYGIYHIANHPNTFGMLCYSICPSIYGHDLVKAGLLLSLFGGVQKIIDPRSKSSVRGDIHVIIVGDPGLGKSQLLKSVSNILPRGVYVCGSYASSSGLTVSVKKESGSHDYSLEAGALVLSDQGCCCIDEFDKMPNDWDALLEAMEQQQISIAKAGIVCNLPARASIIAAANPHQGHYNKSKTVAQNLKMSAPLLSRFDLVFVLLDKPDVHHDDLISDHIMMQHIRNDNTLSSQPSQLNEPSQTNSDLIEKLRNLGTTQPSPIPPQLLRKYIGYAKKFVEPKLSKEAIDIIQNFYLELRKNNKSQDGTPVTTRQLESLIRLAEARAKLELREVVTEQDANDVIEIMKYSLRDAIDPDGFETVDVLQTGKSGKQKMVSIFMKALQSKARSSGKSEFTTQELYTISKDVKLSLPNFMEFVELLNDQNYLLKKGSQLYKLYST